MNLDESEMNLDESEMNLDESELAGAGSPKLTYSRWNNGSVIPMIPSVPWFRYSIGTKDY